MNYDGIIEKPSVDDLIIEHYGVKGMKWRRRKGGNKKVKSLEDANARYYDEASKAKTNEQRGALRNATYYTYEEIADMFRARRRRRKKKKK